MMLYNEFRPDTFDTVEGQESTVTILKKQVMSGSVANAVLLHGHHGCGKTTIARILGRAVNCEHPVNGNPCGTCKSCLMMQSGTPDYIEIDAASNNSVDNIRELIQSAQYIPTALKYKVFVIDEVHMLSSSAFNALLKTLEEPPEHTKFFLCTTEFYKVPETIRSRCQKFLFRALTNEEIVNRIHFIAEQKGISMEEDAITLVAEAGRGAMRDALSVLEQCISSGAYTFEEVRSLVGILPDKYLFDILEAFSKKDIHTIFTSFNGLSIEQLSDRVISEKLLEVVVDRMAYMTAGSSILSGKTKDYITKISSLSIDEADCIVLLEQLSSNYKNIKTSLIAAIAKRSVLSLQPQKCSNKEQEEPVTEPQPEPLQVLPDEGFETAEESGEEIPFESAQSLSEPAEEPDERGDEDECPFDDEPEEEEPEEEPKTDPFDEFEMPW